MPKEKPSLPRTSSEQKGYQPANSPGKIEGGYQAPTGNNAPAKPPNEGTSGTKK